MKKVTKSVFALLLLVVAGIWLATGLYTIKADGGEQAVITRFGKFVKIETEAGLKWHIPAPIERVEIVKCDVLRSMEFGYTTTRTGDQALKSEFSVNPREALMITGDESLVNTETVIQYKITNVRDYLFNVDNPEGTLRNAAVASIRRIVANHTMDQVLTDQKDMVQNEILQDLQEACDLYGLGIRIHQVALQAVYAPAEVEEAFNDVIKAREDRSRYINEARKSRNEIVPAAEGRAAEMLNQANAYKEKRISEARGDVENFNQVLNNYMHGEEVTRTRMYLETMQKVLGRAKIYIMDSDSNTLKFLPIESLQ
ncbi:MAG TPA: FtsH protease activity modulator HflK [Ruminiclostridium sp.]|jgi:membrane protease subunit HflK|nr:FtsH protease activity modulator HflK [Clostridiaceae bacterium]HAA24992.1 FtsH protease activity modulator HflK [Ruminiclostridium sp.]